MPLFRIRQRKPKKQKKRGRPGNEARYVGVQGKLLKINYITEQLVPSHLQCMIEVAVCGVLDANGGHSSTGVGCGIRNKQRLFNTTQCCGNQKWLHILQGGEEGGEERGRGGRRGEGGKRREWGGEGKRMGEERGREGGGGRRGEGGRRGVGEGREEGEGGGEGWGRGEKRGRGEERGGGGERRGGGGRRGVGGREEGKGEERGRGEGGRGGRREEGDGREEGSGGGEVGKVSDCIQYTRHTAMRHVTHLHNDPL